MKIKRLISMILVAAMLVGCLPVTFADEGFEYLSSEHLTGFAESYTSGASYLNAVDGDTTTQWHSNYPGSGTAETETNHNLEDINGNETQSNGGVDKPLGKYNNYYVVLDEAMTVDEVSIYGKWDNGITNGTAKVVNVYVSDQDYSENTTIDWGSAVGTSPEGGFTYSGQNDMNKVIRFAEAQENVKSIRFEFVRTLAGGGSEINKWIRVMELGVSARAAETEEPEIQDTYKFLSVDQMTGVAESWVSNCPASYALDGNTGTNWHSNYTNSGTAETDDNHALEDIYGNETQSNGGTDKPLGKYNNYYIVLDEAMSVDKVTVLGALDPSGKACNGTAKEVKVYVSSEDYTQNKDIDWGTAVGTSPEGGFTYPANDLNKVITFAEEQHNVKTIRFEFIRTYQNGGTELNRWIRVMEFGVSAKPYVAPEPEEPKPEMEIVGYEYMDVANLTGYADSWSADSAAPSVALDGNTAKGSNWHSNYPGTALAESDSNHYLRDINGNICQNTSGGADKPLGQYNNFYLVLDEPNSVDKVSMYALWDNQITNGSAKEVKVYVSDQDYGENKDIDWGEPVGASPEGGFTYAGANDANKEVVFDQPQDNVKSIRIEFIRTYGNGGAEVNKWIRVMEFDVSAAVWGEIDPDQPGDDTPKPITMKAYAESWQTTSGTSSVPSNVVDGDPTTQWHTMYSGTETENNHIPEDANGNETISGTISSMAKYNNLYLVLSENTTVENIFVQAKWDNGMTNGTPRNFNVYVSDQNYEENKDIDWGHVVGSTSDAGLTYKNASDTVKYVKFLEPQENVRTIRIEFTHTYGSGGDVSNRWIRVVEAGFNAEIPETPEYLPLPDEDPIYTIVALADIHTDYGLEVSDAHIRDTAITVMERVREEENPNAIVALGDLFSANDTSHWFAGSASQREGIYNDVLEALYTTLEGGMEDPKVLYVAGNHETEIGCMDFNSQSFVEDLTERTMGEMIAATSVDDIYANAYFEEDMSAVLYNPEGERNVLAYHYNVDGLDYFALNPPYVGRRNSEGLYQFDLGALEWMQNKMEAIGKDKTFIILTHYPVGPDLRNSAGSSVTAAGDAKLREIFSQFPNSIVLYGHVHTQYIVQDTAEGVVAYEEDAVTRYNDTYTTPGGFINMFAGSQGYYGTMAGLTPSGWLSAQTPNYNQALMIYFYSDRIVFQMKNYGSSGGELTPYTIMREVDLTVTIDKSGLENYIAQAEGLVPGGYMPESWQALQEVLAQAREVLTDPDADQMRINAATSALKKSIDNLIEYDEDAILQAQAMEAAKQALAAAREALAAAEEAKTTVDAAKRAADRAKAAAEEAAESSAENNEAAQAAKADAEAAAKAAQDAQKRAEAVVNAAEAAAKAAQDAQAAAESSNLAAAEQARKAAEEAQKAAQSEAQAAKDADAAAASAAAAAEAQAAAQAAQAEAEAAAKSAQAAQDKADQAKTAAEEAAASAAEDKAAVDAAMKAAQDAEEAARIAQADAEASAQAAEDARIHALAAEKAAETADREAAEAAAQAAAEAKKAAGEEAKATEQAALIAGYAAQAAAAQAAAAEAQAKAEAAQKEAEEAAAQSAKEKEAAEEARKAAEEAAAAAKAAAELETAKQAALLDVMLLRNTVGKLTEQQTARYNELMANAIEDITAVGSVEAVEEIVNTLSKTLEDMQASESVLDFDDVPEDAWFYEAVDYVAAHGYMVGMAQHLFVPQGNLTRGQFATILHRLEGAPEMEYEDAFADVQDVVWYTNGILWASTNGIVLGYPGNVFGVDDNITREQMITMFYRYAGSYKGMDTEARADLSEFVDAESVSDYAQDAMSWAVSVGLIQGMPGTEGLLLNPKGSTTRAECAIIIQRFMENIVQ